MLDNNTKVEFAEQFLWVEKYRPKKLDDMVLPEEYKRVFNKWIAEKEIPNLLFIGRPGSGKTTLARILVNEILDDESDLLYLNGSSQRGIATVNELIEDFLKAATFGQSKIKIVFIDEFDYMTPTAQAALRAMIETYSDNNRFIFTANYEKKIIDAIISRTQLFRFQELPKEHIYEFCVKILTNENVNFDKSIVEKIVNVYYPDIRKIVGVLQSRSKTGNLVVSEIDLETLEKKILDLIKILIQAAEKKDIRKANQVFLEIQRNLKDDKDFIDFALIYEEIAFSELEMNNPIVTLYSSYYFDKHSTTASPALNFLAFLIHLYTAISQQH